MIAKGFINLLHVRSAFNLVDTLSKHWSHQANYENLIKPLLNFYDYETEKDENENVITESELEELVEEYHFELSQDQAHEGNEKIHKIQDTGQGS